MKNSVLKYFFCGAMALGLAATVQANNITGGISLAGGPIATSPSDLALATSITSFGTVRTTDVSGDYSSVPFGTTVPTTTGFTFLPNLSPNTVMNVWDFTYNGKDYSFDLSAIQSVDQGVNANGTHFLTISGTGTLHITGFTDTPGSYLFTANSASSTFSFSSSNGALPDGGATAMLLGAALSGLALIRRKRI